MTIISRLTAAFAIVLFTVLAVAPLPAEGQGSPESDRAALVEFYHALDGDNWNVNDGWLSDRPVWEWAGVEACYYHTSLDCGDMEGRVTKIDLYLRGSRNNVNGSIPIVDLPFLNTLIIGNSNLRKEENLYGRIPRGLGNYVYPRLRKLHLYGNLTGEIPSDLRRSRITELRLGGNFMGEIPSGLVTVGSVAICCGLTGTLPPDLGSLAGGGSRYVGGGIWLGGNNLSGEIPSEYATRTGYSHTVPYTIALGNNNLTGEIPNEPGHWQGHIQVTLSGNRLTGVIPRRLREQEHKINPQQGGRNLPHEFQAVDPETDRAALEAIYDALGGENWTRGDNWKTDLPLSEWSGVGIDDYGRVDTLSIGGGGVAGEIPREIGNLRHLRELRIGSTRSITGEIPREIGNLTLLETLQIRRTNLTGEIPRELGNSRFLRELRLEDNNLTGEIPRELGNSQFLRELWLRENNLTGIIPRELRRFRNRINPQQGDQILPVEGAEDIVDPVSAADKAVLLAFADATNCCPQGYNWSSTLPVREWRGVTTSANRVTGLSVPHAGLTGMIPPELANLPLENLVLYGNSLTGVIPDELAEFASTINPQANGRHLRVGTASPSELRIILSSESLSVTEGESVILTATANRPVTEDLTITLTRASGLGSLATSDDYTVSDIVITSGQIEGSTRLFATQDDLDGEGSETLVLRGQWADDKQTSTLRLTIWDAAVPALPFVGALLLACGLYVMGRRKMLRPH